MATLATGLMTAEDFYDFVHRPENQGRFFELERGEVVEMPPPTKIHGFVCGNVSGTLWVYGARTGSGYICTNDSGVIVRNNPDSVRGPDICFYHDDQTLDTMERKYASKPPTLVVEVFSPNDQWGTMLGRVGEYLRRGVKRVWVIDPESRAMSVHRAGDEPIRLDETDTLTGEDYLPGFSCPVADFFTRPGKQIGSEEEKPKQP